MKSFQTFSIFDHLDKLQVVKETASEFHCVCPVCGDDNLKIQKTGSNAGRYACYSTGCTPKEIRDMIAPLTNRSLTPRRQTPKSKPAQKAQPPAPPNTEVHLAKLPAPTTDSPKPRKDFDPKLGEILKTTYVYSLTPDGQIERWIIRTDWADFSKPKGRNKAFRQWHRDASGKAVCKKGDIAWEAYRIDEFIRALKATTGCPFGLVVEGEKCVEACRLSRLAATTLQGSAWRKGDLQQLAERVKSECPNAVLVFLRDNDTTGEKKAKEFQSACKACGLFCLIIDPLAIYPDLNEGEDVAEILAAMDTPEFIRRLEEEIHKAIELRRNLIAESVNTHNNFAPGVGKGDGFDPEAPEGPTSQDPDWVGTGTVEALILDTLFEGGKGRWATIEDTFYEDTGKGHWKKVSDKVVLQAIALKCKTAYQIVEHKGQKKKIFPFFTDSKIQSAFKANRNALDAGKDWLSNTHLRCFLNCTVDFRTGKTLPHDKSHFLTTKIAADYEPNQPCPEVFLNFIRSAFGEDLIEPIRAYTSMLLDPTAPKGKFIHLMGPSGSGKGTLLRLWGEMFGLDHFRSGDFKNLSTAEGRHQYLTGASLFTVPDVGGYVQGLKPFYELVDNGPMSGRALFSSIGYQKLWNTRFVIASVDHLAVENAADGWDRRCLPLPTKTREGIEDPNLGKKLCEVKGQIISWALGMPREERDRLILHPSTNSRVLALKQDAAIHGDPVRAFVDLCLRPGDEAKKIHSYELHTWFAAFAQEHGYQGWGMSKLINHLKTILPQHYSPRRKVGGALIPAHWVNMVPRFGVFVDISQQGDDDSGSKHYEPMWKCIKSECQEGGLAAFTEFRKGGGGEPGSGSGSPGSPGSPTPNTSPNMTDPAETTQNQGFEKSGSAGSAGSDRGGVDFIEQNQNSAYTAFKKSPWNDVYNSPTPLSDLADPADPKLETLDITLPSPEQPDAAMADPNDPGDPKPETLDIAYQDLEQSIVQTKKLVADPPLVPDPNSRAVKPSPNSAATDRWENFRWESGKRVWFEGQQWRIVIVSHYGNKEVSLKPFDADINYSPRYVPMGNLIANGEPAT